MNAFPPYRSEDLSAHHPSVARIQRTVAEVFDVALIEMTSQRRAREVARPRQVAMYLSKQLTPLSLPNIGRQFGNRDHSTVHHAITRIEELMGQDAGLTASILEVKRRFGE